VQDEAGALSEAMARADADWRRRADRLKEVAADYTGRRARGRSELVRDGVELALEEECRALQRGVTALQQLSQRALQRCWSLQRSAAALQEDAAAKAAALNTDDGALALTMTKAVTLHPDPHGDTPLDVQDWFSASTNTMQDAEKGVRDSIQLRRQIFCALKEEEAEAGLRSAATDYQLRQRNRETENALAEMGRRRDTAAEEIQRMEAEIAKIEEEQRHALSLLMTAQSRLEARKQRPQPERTADDANTALLYEEDTLQRSRASLESVVTAARRSLNELQNNLAILDKEIAAKKIALDVDIKVLRSRASLHTPPTGALSPTVSSTALLSVSQPKL